MDRRHFLRTSAVASLGGLTLRGFSNPLLQALYDRSGEDRVLVVVQLYGGNDGLNTVIPLDQYAALAPLRTNVLIPEAQVLPLNGLSGTGFHPALTGLRTLWNENKLAIVQGVSYPDPNFSHFRSTDIWETGADSNQILTSGWTARYLHQAYPNYPAGYPNPDMPDPLAIRIGGPIGPSLTYMGISMGTAIYETNDQLDLSGNIYNDPVGTLCSGDKLEFVRMVQRQTDLYGDVIAAAAAQNCTHSSLYNSVHPAGTELARALRIVAQLICGGLKTRIYWVSIGGFDTHAQQVVAGSPTTGTHANLLRGVSDSIRAFQHDLQLLGLQDRVLGMTFSEFGRRIVDNASLGTDHGSAMPMFLFGTKVIPGMLGTNPVIPPGATYQTNLAMQYDFRSVYASVLRDWFCLTAEETQAVLLNTYQPLTLIDPSGCIGAGLNEVNQQAGDDLLSAWPNPFTERVTLRYTSHGGQVLLQVFDEQGRLVRTVLNRPVAAGTHTVDADLGDASCGVYYARLQNGSAQQVRNLLKVR